MKFSTILTVLLAALLALPAPAAWADSLEMKDGRVVEGKYLGGTRASIRFQSSTDKRIRTYRVADVLTVTFGEAATPAASTSPVAGAPLSTPAARTSRNTITLPAGTRLMVRMIDSVNSETNRVGDRFHASLSEDLRVDGMLVARRGADVSGQLVEVKEAGAITGRSQLTLALTEIRLNGELQSLAAADYSVRGESHTAESAKRIGGAAAIGAGIGAGAGTAVQILTRGERVRVPSETVLEFRLEQSATLRVGPAAAR